jgi:hypothetical protein
MGVSKSGLDLLHRSPALYHMAQIHPRPPTPAQTLGTAIHMILLEPERAQTELVADPYRASRSKEAIAWRTEQAVAGRIVLALADDTDPWSPSPWVAARSAVGAVRAHPMARALLDTGRAEVSGYWTDPDYGILCRIRPDWLDEAHQVVVDLKTTRDAGMDAFARSAIEYRYHVQAAYYVDGLTACGWQPQAFLFVVVETVPPYGVALYRVTDEDLELGRTIYRADLRTYHACLRDDSWPAYPEDIRDLELPPWARTTRVR